MEDGRVGVVSDAVVVSVQQFGNVGFVVGRLFALGEGGGEFVYGDVFQVVFGASGWVCAGVGALADLKGDGMLSVGEEDVVAVGVFAFQVILRDGDCRKGGEVGAGSGVEDVFVGSGLPAVWGAGGDDDGGDAIGEDDLVSVVVLGDNG